MSSTSTGLQLPPGQYAIGMSLGTDSCVVAAASGATSGRIDICFNDVGDRVTPTYVAFSSGEIHAGLPAKQTLVRQPMQTVPHLLAMLVPQISGKLRVACETQINENDDMVSFPNIDPDAEDESAEGSARYDAAKVLSIFFGKVKETVINAVCAGSTSAIASIVISVPRFVSSLTVVRNTALEAGIVGSTGDNSLHVIYDDSAAVLAAGLCSSSSSSPPLPLSTSSSASWILVLDWGALSLSVSLWEASGPERLPRLLAHVHRFNALGGKKLDEEVALQLAQGFQRKTKMDPMENARSKRKLYQAAETVKKTLSAASTTSAEIEAFFEGVDLKEAFSRVKLESIIRDKKYIEFVEGAVSELLDQAIEDHVASSADRDLALLLSSLVVTAQGGMFRIPMIGPAVQLMLGNLLRSRQRSLQVGVEEADSGSPTRHTDPMSSSAPLAVKFSPELPGISADEQAAAGACVQALLSLPRLCRMAGRTDVRAASREIHAACGNSISSPAVLSRNVYLLVGTSSSGIWTDSQMSSRQSSACDGCYSFAEAELVLIAGQGSPLPHEVELHFEADHPPGNDAAASRRAIALFREAKSGSAAKSLAVVPLLETPIARPSDAAAVFLLFDVDDHLVLRFVTADGSNCSVGEIRHAVQGNVE